MRTKFLTGGLALAGVLAWVSMAQQGEVKAAIDNSLKSMRAEGLKTVVFSGEGFDACVGQGYTPTGAWRRFLNKNYVRSIDFEARGWRMQRLRTDVVPSRGGCSAGPYADQNQNQVTRLTANSNWNQQLDYIMLPTGFLRTAASKDTSVKSETIKGRKFTVLTFMGDNRAPVSGYIGPEGYIERVATMIDNNVLGDIPYETTFTNWKDFGGTKFPTHMTQTQGDWPIFDLNITDVKANAAVDLSQQAKGKGPGGDAKGKAKGGPPPPPQPEDLGNGFYLITGGYAAIVANFKDYVVVLEGPQNDARAEQIINDAKRLAPGKAIRYVFNTHAHFDHSGGLRAFVAEGVTILTSQKYKGYYEKTFTRPHTLVPDKLSTMSPQPKAKVEYLGEKKILTDGEHTIELHRVKDSTHDEGMMIAYLPQQKLILEGDEFNVGQANAPRPAVPNPYHVNLLANIERLKLDVERIVPVHLPGDGRNVTLAELRTAAGK